MTERFKTGRGEHLKWLRDHVDYQHDYCLIWPFRLRHDGYGEVGWQNWVYKAHRVMCELAHGPAPSPQQNHAAHECGNGHHGCVNPRHLKWKTQSENERDKKIHGTDASHTWKRRKTRAILTVEQVAEIKALSGIEPQLSLAARFGISQSHVSRIHRGDLWPKVRPQVIRV